MSCQKYLKVYQDRGSRWQVDVWMGSVQSSLNYVPPWGLNISLLQTQWNKYLEMVEQECLAFLYESVAP